MILEQHQEKFDDHTEIYKLCPKFTCILSLKNSIASFPQLSNECFKLTN